MATFDYEFGHTDPDNTGYDALKCFLDYLCRPRDSVEDFVVTVRLHTSSTHGKARMAYLLQEARPDLEAAGVQLTYDDPDSRLAEIFGR